MSPSEAMDAGGRPIITIRGERVGLGPLRRDLLETVHVRWGNDLAAGLMQGGVGFGTSAHSQRFFEHRTSNADIQEFLIYELETLQPIGAANLHEINLAERSAEIAWNIMEHEHRRKGFGAEATRLTLDFAFTALGLHRVQAEVFAYNEPSIQLAHKVGFRAVGRLREARWAGDRYWDVLLFDMLQQEFESPVLARSELSFLRDPGES